MAIRWRKDGTLLCAAHFDEEETDTYIDDRLHYQLSVELKVLVPVIPPVDEYPWIDERGHTMTEERWEWCASPPSPDLYPIWDYQASCVRYVTKDEWVDHSTNPGKK